MKFFFTGIAICITSFIYAQDAQQQTFFERIQPSYTIGWHFNTQWGDNLKSSLQTSFLYEFHPRIYSGIGLGVEKHSTSILPIFGDLRYLLTKKKNRMYLNVKVGHNTVLGDNDYHNRRYKGGVYSFIGIGHFVPLNKSLDLEISAGYKHLQINSIDDYNGDIYILPVPGRYLETFNRFEMRIGLLLR